MRKKYTRLQVQSAVKRAEEVWLYSYADLITNLLAFFIMVTVLMTGSQETRDSIQSSIAKMTGKGALSGRDSGQVVEELDNVVSEFVKERNLKNQIALQRDINGISLTFSGGFLFDTLSAEIKPEAQAMLEQLIPLVNRLPKSMRVDVGGHADARPIQDNEKYASNWELSSARAGAVVRFLSQKGIQERRMRAIGYASTQPVSDNLDENRRVVIRIGRGVVE